MAADRTDELIALLYQNANIGEGHVSLLDATDTLARFRADTSGYIALGYTQNDIAAAFAKIDERVSDEQYVYVFHAFDVSNLNPQAVVDDISRHPEYTDNKKQAILKQVALQAEALASPELARAKIAEAMAKEMSPEQMERLEKSGKLSKEVREALLKYRQIKVQSEATTQPLLEQLGLHAADLLDASGQPLTAQQLADKAIKLLPTLPKEKAKAVADQLVLQTQLADANWKLYSAQAEAEARKQQALAATLPYGQILREAGIGDSPEELLEAWKKGTIGKILREKGYTTSVVDAFNKSFQGVIDSQKKVQTLQAEVDQANATARKTTVDAAVAEETKEAQIRRAKADARTAELNQQVAEAETPLKRLWAQTQLISARWSNAIVTWMDDFFHSEAGENLIGRIMGKLGEMFGGLTAPGGFLGGRRADAGGGGGSERLASADQPPVFPGAGPAPAAQPRAVAEVTPIPIPSTVFGIPANHPAVNGGGYRQALMQPVAAQPPNQTGGQQQPRGLSGRRTAAAAPSADT